MIKLRYFVHCEGWATGGYQNVSYFETAKEARDWAKRQGVTILELKRVTLEEFAEDYIG